MTADELIVVAWLIVGGVSLWYLTRKIRDTRTTYRTLQSKKERFPIEFYLVETRFTRELIAIGVQGCLFLAGLASLVMIGGLYTAGFLLVGQGALAFMAYLVHRHHHNLINMVFAKTLETMYRDRQQRRLASQDEPEDASRG